MSRHLIEELKFNSREALLAVQPAAQGEEAGGLPVRKLLEAVFRTRYLVMGTTGFGLLIGAFLAITTPNSFVSQGKFMFTQAGSESIQVDPTRISETKGESISLNASYVFRADPLLRRVVDLVGAPKVLQPYTPGGEAGGLRALFHGIQRDWNSGSTAEVNVDEAMKKLQRSLVVDKPRFSDVLLVSYEANDPFLAQQILQAYMEQAIQWHLEVYDDPKRFEEVQKRAEEAAAEEAVAKRAMREFLEGAGVQDAFDVELRRLRAQEAESAGLVSKNALDIEGASREIAALEENLKQVQPTRTVRRRLDNAEEVRLLQAERARAMGERAVLASRVAVVEGNPQIAELDRRIQQIEAELGRANERQRTAGEIPIEEINPDYTVANTQLSTRRMERVRYEGVREMLRQNHEQIAGRLKRMLDLEPTFQQLNEALRRAETEAGRTSTALAEAQRKRDLRLGNFSSLQKIEDASLPLEKEGPNRSKLILGGFFVGLFLGLGVVVTRSLPDTVVRVREDLDRLGAAPVIGVVPRLDPNNLRRHQARRERGW